VAPALLGAGAATQVLTPDAGATQVMPGDAPAWAPTGPGTSVLPPQNGEEPEEEKKSKRWLWITLSVVAVLAVAGIVWLLTQDREPDVRMVEVPAVAGQAEAAATSTLTTAGFEVVRQEEPSADVPQGSVTRTDPAGGEDAEEGSEVTLFVSTGPTAVTVPDVSGLTQDQARQQLTDAGLTVGSVREDDNPAQPEGRALGTEPGANQSVAEGSSVTLVISSGNVELPDLAGQTEDAAKETLNGLKLTANTSSEESADAAPGTVIRQDRAPGLVRQGSTVNLVIATAPTTVTIPNDIVGKSEADATAQLQGLGLTVDAVSSDDPSSQPAGTVLSSDPRAGSTVPLNSTVTLTLSSGPNPTGGSQGSSGGGSGSDG
jgi:serine/threonine-protein kinase